MFERSDNISLSRGRLGKGNIVLARLHDIGGSRADVSLIDIVFLSTSFQRFLNIRASDVVLRLARAIFIDLVQEGEDMAQAKAFFKGNEHHFHPIFRILKRRRQFRSFVNTGTEVAGRHLRLLGCLFAGIVFLIWVAF